MDTAYGIKTTLGDIYTHKGPCLLEVFVDVEQPFSPKLASRKLDDGTMYSPPLDDMAPFWTEASNEGVMKRLRDC